MGLVSFQGLETLGGDAIELRVETKRGEKSVISKAFEVRKEKRRLVLHDSDRPGTIC